MSITRRRPLHADFTASGNVENVKVVGFLTSIDPTVCGHWRRDKAYYCIKSADHPGRHKYGIVYEGRWEGTLA